MSEPTQPSTPSFRWYSTVESAENLEFSVLALLESVGAVTLSLFTLSLFTLGCGVYVLYDAIPWTEIFKDFQWLPKK